MSVTAIITEYNPLHTGHLAQIKHVKETRRAEILLVVMSGSFVQRGEPAIVDKYRRCAMALDAGADLVLELPPAYATGSAEVFARGAVGILKACGFVEEIVFGASCRDVDRLRLLAVQTASPAVASLLDQAHRTGLSYPAALGKALESIDPEGAALLRDPNNLLAMEYLRAMQEQKAAWNAVALPRWGAAHGSLELPEEGHASASAIRKALRENRPEVSAFLAPGVLDKLDYRLFPDDLSPALTVVLLDHSRSSDSGLQTFADVSGELAARILQQAPFLYSFTELTERVGSRAFTAARIRRALLHILLRIRREDQGKLPRSLKILGLRTSSEAGALLKKRAALPLITKTADAAPGLAEEYAYAQRVYNQAVYHKSGLRLPDDYARSPLLRP